MQFSSHRRSFVGTTILASFSSIALIILVGTTIHVPWWAIGQHLLPEWGIRILAGLAAVALSTLARRSAVSSSSFETPAKNAEYHIFQFDRASELLVR